MRTLFLFLPMLLTACSQPASDGAGAGMVEAGSVAGLYEKPGISSVPDRICITGEGGTARFGMVTQGQAGRSCSAKGHAQRTGRSLALRIEGSPDCAVSATMSATGLTLDGARGAECVYYCGRDAAFGSGAFTKTGTSEVDIRKVVDLVGEPLC